MSRVTEEDLSKASIEFMGAKRKVDAMIKRQPNTPTREIEHSFGEIERALGETEILMRKWHDLVIAYVTQR